MAKKPTIEEIFDESEESNIDFSIFGDEIKLKELNDKHAFIRFYDDKPMIQCSVYSSVHNKKILTFITPDAFAMQYSNQNIEIAGEKNAKYIELGKWWVKHPKRREYETIIFDPMQGREYMDCFNLWEGFNCVSTKGSWRLTRKHIWKILCNRNKEKYKYVIKWFAWMMQNPHERAEVALVFKGKQGAGKGFVLTQFVEMFGRHGLQIANRDHLTGKFSGHLKLIVFLYADEAYYPGDKEVEGTLKNLITENKITREAKFAHPVLDKNRLHIVMSTNQEWIIPVGGDSRRFFVNEVDNRYAKNETTNIARKIYFDKLWSEMAHGGREAMLHDLLTMNIKGWHPRDDVPETEELRRQQQMSVPRADKTIKEFLENGEFPGEYTIDRRYQVKAGELYHYMDETFPDGKKVSMNFKWSVLQKLGATKNRSAKGIFIWFPALNIMRNNWDIHYPKGEWDLTEDWIVRKSEY